MLCRKTIYLWKRFFIAFRVLLKGPEVPDGENWKLLHDRQEMLDMEQEQDILHPYIEMLAEVFRVSTPSYIGWFLFHITS